MKNFNFKKYLFAVIAVFIVYQLLDFLIHSILLNSVYESITGVWREDMDPYMWITIVTGLVFSIFFVYLYHYFTSAYGKGGWKAGLYYGLVVGFLMLVTGMFNQYAVYDGLTATLAWQWFLYGLIELAIVGIIAGLVYKPLEIE